MGDDVCEKHLGNCEGLPNITQKWSALVGCVGEPMAELDHMVKKSFKFNRKIFKSAFL